MFLPGFFVDRITRLQHRFIGLRMALRRVHALRDALQKPRATMVAAEGLSSDDDAHETDKPGSWQLYEAHAQARVPGGDGTGGAVVGIG